MIVVILSTIIPFTVVTSFQTFSYLETGEKAVSLYYYYDSVDGTRDSGTRTLRVVKNIIFSFRMNVSARTNYIKQHMKHSVSTIIVISTSTQYFKKFLRKTNTEMKMVSNFTTHCLILLRKIPCIFILDF